MKKFETVKIVTAPREGVTQLGTSKEFKLAKK